MEAMLNYLQQKPHDHDVIIIVLFFSMCIYGIVVFLYFAPRLAGFKGHLLQSANIVCIYTSSSTLRDGVLWLLLLPQAAL